LQTLQCSSRPLSPTISICEVLEAMYALEHFSGTPLQRLSNPESPSAFLFRNHPRPDFASPPLPSGPNPPPQAQNPNQLPLVMGPPPPVIRPQGLANPISGLTPQGSHERSLSSESSSLSQASSPGLLPQGLDNLRQDPHSRSFNSQGSGLGAPGRLNPQLSFSSQGSGDFAQNQGLNQWPNPGYNQGYPNPQITRQDTRSRSFDSQSSGLSEASSVGGRRKGACYMCGRISNKKVQVS
jgi:hypothetical protein